MIGEVGDLVVNYCEDNVVGRSDWDIQTFRGSASILRTHSGGNLSCMYRAWFLSFLFSFLAPNIVILVFSNQLISVVAPGAEICSGAEDLNIAV